MLSAVEQSWVSRSPYFLHSIYQSNPQPREASGSFRSSGSSAPAQREPRAEFINMQVPIERLAEKCCCRACPILASLLLTSRCQISLLLWEGPCMGCSFPDPSFYVGSDCCWLRSSWCWDIYIWWCRDELCTHPTEHSFNEGISFLFLALAFNGF